MTAVFVLARRVTMALRARLIQLQRNAKLVVRPELRLARRFVTVNGEGGREEKTWVWEVSYGVVLECVVWCCC